MNIVYSTSDLYSELAGISITSLLINNIEIPKIHIFIIDNGISENNKKKLCDTIHKYQRKITFIDPKKIFRKLDVNIQKWNISTFGRLFLASLLNECSKVIHIDCDTVILGSLKDLWDIDMKEAVVAGAPDCLSNAYKYNIGLKPTDTYINAGILVLNLEMIRLLELEVKFNIYIREKGNLLTYVDQEVLNACIAETQKLKIPLYYNSYTILHYLKYRQLEIFRCVENMFSKESYKKAIDNAIIIHYTSCFLEGTRPWIRGDKHPKRSVFLRYKKLSEWAEISYWKDNRTVFNKIGTRFVKIIPKCILAPIVGYIHGVYIPQRNSIRQKEDS